MVTLDRQDIIANNKSLRLIKNELENLLEKGVITDDVFDSISRQLPAESPLSAASPAAMGNANANLALRQNPSPLPSPLSSSLLDANPASPAPPAYNATGPPSLPSRNQQHQQPQQRQQPPPPPPPATPAKLVIARARALYRYQAADDRDLSFETDDRIAVHEYMNADWWMGRNERSGAEGIFPKTYVQIDHSEKAGFYAPSPSSNPNPYSSPAQPVYASPPPAHGAYPPPPQAQNPYNSHVPPMAVTDGGGGAAPAGSSKVNEAGKKFGKKLGNAAIFGAGATLGGNLVNSIF
ncbi:SH3 domain-containing protein [Nemania sp. FL0916]|nr:SH3 domain-containing protein [Nemania sp. FL0916]